MFLSRTAAARMSVIIAVIATGGYWTQAVPPAPIPTVHQHAPMYFAGETMIEQGPADPKGQVGSGGRAVAHYPGAIKIRKKKIVRRAPDARLYRTGHPNFEPTMGITEDGSILVDAVTEQSEPIVIRSQDGAKSWEVVLNSHITTNDPYLYVDPTTSRIFSNDFIIPCHIISISDDEGDTWADTPYAGCGYNADHQTIFAGPAPEGGDAPNDYPNVVYLCSIADGASLAAAGTACSKSLDGGLTFLPTGTQAFVDDPTKPGDLGVPGLCNGANGHGFVGSDGTVYLPRGWCGQPYLAISHDEGLTWNRIQVADNGMPCCANLGTPGVDTEIYSHEAGVVADGFGNVYYTWVANDRLPYLAISRDRGESWGAPMMIGPPGLREALLPGIAIGKSGRVVTHYMGSSNSPWNGTVMDGDPSITRWNAYMTMTVGALAPRPVFYSGTINDPAQPLWIGPCGPDPARCAWGDFFDVVIGAGGEPWAIAIDLCATAGCAGLGEGIVGRLLGGPKLN